jgi:hypothetical protein
MCLRSARIRESGLTYDAISALSQDLPAEAPGRFSLLPPSGIKVSMRRSRLSCVQLGLPCTKRKGYDELNAT